MHSTGKERACNKVEEAMDNLTRMEKEYGKIVMQFVGFWEVVAGRSCNPRRVLDEKGLAEIREAEAKKQEAQEAVSKALEEYWNLMLF